MEDYEAPWWLLGRHCQTLVSSVLPKPAVAWRRERWRTPDGDFVDVDWAGPEHAPRLLVVFHGLEGSSDAHYARRIGAAALAAGAWRVTVPHFRSCSGEPNVLARLYYSGDSAEIGWMLERFRGRSDAALSALGVSLGGNSLLKWLCERGASARSLLGRAVAISAQFDLRRSALALGSPWDRIYGWLFLKWFGMRDKALAKFAAFNQELAALGVREERVKAAATLREFDDAFVAPLHHFGNAASYWQLCSTNADLGRIALPTLLLSARNDPFYPGGLLPGAPPSPWIECDFPAEGGHGGFPGRNNWLGRRVLEFLSPP